MTADTSPVDRQGGEARNHEAVREKVARAAQRLIDSTEGQEVCFCCRERLTMDDPQQGHAAECDYADLRAALDDARSSGSAAQKNAVRPCPHCGLRSNESVCRCGYANPPSGSAAQNHEGRCAEGYCASQPVCREGECRKAARSPQGEDHTTAEGELEGELRDDLPSPRGEDHEAGDFGYGKLPSLSKLDPEWGRYIDHLEALLSRVSAPVSGESEDER